MKKNYACSMILFVILCCTACVNQSKPVVPQGEVRKENFVFAVKGTDTLSLDKYELRSIAPAGKKPVMLFVFGGGFKGGDKARPDYIPYFDFLARNGFVVISTDYRTTLKDLDQTKVASAMDFMPILQNAIDTAVEDFYDATLYVLSQGNAWNIDPEQLVISGSSAGAITVLQAEYYLCNGGKLASRLPADFNYAGVISYAGAVLSQAFPTWNRMPCPMMLFHGTADKTVPFEQAAIKDVGGLWGSASIARSLEEAGASCYFYKVENAGHEIADLPMARDRYAVMSFLMRQVLGGEKLVVTTDERIPGDTITKQALTLQDYIQENLR